MSTQAENVALAQTNSDAPRSPGTSVRTRLSGVRRGVVGRLRRAIIWRRLLEEGARHGYHPADFRRFHHYLSTNLGLEQPAHTHPLQAPRNHFPGLRDQPVYQSSEIPAAAAVAANFEAMRKELADFTTSIELDAHPQDLTDRGRWSVLYFHAGGQPVKAMEQACPITANVIAQFPGAGQAGQTYVSVLRPDTHILPHCGPTNTRLRCHIGLSVPEGAHIRVGTQDCHWQEGACLIFDDSFEHEVWNDSDRERAVLIVDFWHPDLTEAERWAINAARRMRWGLRDILHA